MIFAAPIEVGSSLCSRSSVIEIISRIMTVGIRVRACWSRRDRAGTCFKQDDHDGNHGDGDDNDDGQYSPQHPQKPLDAIP